jgi:hypothetical protein
MRTESERRRYKMDREVMKRRNACSENPGGMWKSILQYIREHRKPVAILTTNTWTTVEFAARYARRYQIYKCVGENYSLYLESKRRLKEDEEDDNNG